MGDLRGTGDGALWSLVVGWAVLAAVVAAIWICRRFAPSVGWWRLSTAAWLVVGGYAVFATWNDWKKTENDLSKAIQAESVILDLPDDGIDSNLIESEKKMQGLDISRIVAAQKDWYDAVWMADPNPDYAAEIQDYVNKMDMSQENGKDALLLLMDMEIESKRKTGIDYSRPNLIKNRDILLSLMIDRAKKYKSRHNGSEAETVRDVIGECLETLETLNRKINTSDEGRQKYRIRMNALSMLHEKRLSESNDRLIAAHKQLKTRVSPRFGWHTFKPSQSSRSNFC